MIWSFGPFELDDARYELRRDGRALPIRRKVFDVLRYLAAHPGRLIAKDELLRGVWPGETVHEAVLPQNIAILRKLLCDQRKGAALIQTVHGRGYRFVAQLTEQPAAGVTVAAAPKLPAGAPLIGRERVMAELDEALRGALAGRGRLVWLTGEAGIGKTRVAAELAARAAALRARVLLGSCLDDAGAPAYWPFIQVLRAAGAEDQPGGAGPEVQQLLRSVREPPRARATLAWDDSAEGRFRLFDAVASFLAGVARTRPVVLVFEDLHFADEASLLLLRLVARELRALPCLLLCTCRELEAPEAPNTVALQALAGDSQALRVYLRGLSQDETRALVTATAGAPIDDAELHALHALTHGNPFLVQEVAHLQGARIGGPALPGRAQEILALRLRDVPREAASVLRVAAVAGSELRLPVLTALMSISQASLLALLSRCVRARLLVVEELAAQGRVHRFAHALIRETLYGSLDEAERVRLHGQIGLVLEQLYGVDAAQHLPELAHHFQRAAGGGHAERAVHYCTRAAEAARELFAFEQAVAWYRAALEALACQLPVDESRRFVLKLALGTSLFQAGRDGTATLLSAAELARRLHDPERLAQVTLALRGWPRFGYRGRTVNRELSPLLAEALATLPPERLALRARLLCTSALNLPVAAPSAHAATLSQEALDLAHESGDGEAIYDALQARLQLMHAPEDIPLRLSLVAELVGRAESSGKLDRRFTAHALRIQPLLAQGDLEDADAEIALCRELAQQTRLPRFRVLALRFDLERALGDGRFADVATLTEQLVELSGVQRRTPLTFVGVHIWSFYARLCQGELASLAREAQWLQAEAGATPLLRSLVALVHARSGRLPEARQAYAPLLARELLHGPRDDSWLTTVVQTADAVALCGDTEAAELLYPCLLPHAALNVTHPEMMVYLGSCALWLGLLDALAGRREAALAHYEAALALNAKLRAGPALARTRLAKTQLLRGRTEPTGRAARSYRRRSR